MLNTRVEIWRYLKKAECRRIDAFELWGWKRLLRVPWTARRSNQSILKEISSGCSLEGLMLRLKLQYFGHLMWRVDSLEKTLILGRIGGKRRRGWQRMRWLDGITELSEHQGLMMEREAWRALIHGVAKSRTRLSDWTELNWTELCLSKGIIKRIDKEENIFKTQKCLKSIITIPTKKQKTNNLRVNWIRYFNRHYTKGGIV